MSEAVTVSTIRSAAERSVWGTRWTPSVGIPAAFPGGNARR